MGNPRDIGRKMAELGREMGRARRAEAEKRKSEFLHTRVSDVLKEKVKGRSEELGIPASILIRNILEAYFDLPESEQNNPKGFDVKLEKSDISGWQEFVSNKTRSCSSCGRNIEKGDKAFRGLDDNGNFLDVHCKVCVSEYLS